MNGTQICLLGLNHKSASIDQRERAALTRDEIPPALARIRESGQLLEAVLISTCNRTELYALMPESTPAQETLQSFLSEIKPALLPEDFNDFYFYSEERAIEHLFMVCAGLDSLVVGEPQITGQVKDAFRTALDADASGACLNRLFSMAAQCAKQVRTNTCIAQGAVSVAFAAVKLAEKIFKRLDGRKVLLIGSGETGELVARHMRKRNVGQIIITNRTLAKAEALARSLNGDAQPFEKIESLIPDVDLVIGSTGSPDYVLTKSSMQKMRTGRKATPLVMIDIAMPRDFEPAINRLNNVFLSDLDSLNQVVEENTDRRSEEVKAAVDIINEYVTRFQQWRQSLVLTPTIVSLRKKLESIRDTELKKHFPHTSREEYEAIEKATQGLLNKILHVPMSQLKRYRNGSFDVDTVKRIDVIREIFDLENEV